MKIALIRKKFDFHGGAEIHISELIKALIKKNHEVHLFANKWGKIEGVSLHKIPLLPFGSFFRTLSFALMANLKISKDKFDIVQSNEKTVSQDIYRAGDGCHKEWLRIRNSHRSVLSQILTKISPFHITTLLIEKKIFKQGNYKKIIANSKMGKEEIIKHYDVPEDDINVIYNGVDLEKYKPARDEEEKEGLRKAFGLDKNSIALLFAGSGSERKGLRFLLEALAKLKDKNIKLLLVGKITKSDYSSFLKNNGIDKNVIFTGPVKDIEKMYQRSDIFILPTLYDPFSNVVLEAMASGLPVITTSKNGASEIIKHGKNGFVLDAPDDIDEMAKHIKTLRDIELIKKMGRKARSTAEGFPISRNVEEVLKLYKNVVDGLKPSRTGVRT